MRIEEIDKNFKLETTLPEEDIVWLNARDEVFDLYGLYNPRTEDRFHRAPKEVCDKCNDGVRGLEGHTAGGRIRFKTDSPFIALKAEYWLNHMPHMPLSGSSGFDIYMQKTASLHIYIPPFQKPIANTVLNISKNSLLK